VTTADAKACYTRARKQGWNWSAMVDGLNHQNGIDLDRVLAQARRTYHPASEADRARLGEAVKQ